MAPGTPVAIVGMSVLFPGAPDLDTYWRNIVEGVDAIREVPGDRWDAEHYPDPVYCRRGGFVDASVDVTRFGIMPNSVPGTEPDQLIALEVAAAAIADAGGALPEDRQRAGIILGRGGYLTPGLVRLDQQVRTASQVVRTLRELVPDLTEAQLDRVRDAFDDHASPESAIGLVPNLAASRVANRLDLRGPAYTVDAACASSLVAVDHAVRELDSGRCDVVLAGGVHHCHDITLWSVFSRLGALSRSERIRPLHRDADGVLIGEGTGVVVLKRLSDAERDGDRVYAVIAGTGVASDGRTASLVNPDPGGQVRAVRQAWDAAGLDPAAPDSIGLLEAHGTATPAGDGAELRTIAEVFGAPVTGERAVIGSVKSMIGHTMPAAGVAGLVKAALALYHGVLPPTLHCEDPNPALAATRFAPLTTARAWPAGAPRRAGVNAFGFGGVNAHVVLDAPVRRPTAVTEPERVLRLAAPDRGTLAALLDAADTDVLAAGLDERTTVTDPVRLGVVDPTARRLALARKAVAKGTPWRGRSDVWFSPAPLGGRIAFLFPGLEAGFEPNVDGLAAAFGLPWTVDDTADGVVGDVGRHGRAVFQLGRVLDTALRRLGIVPDAVAGHSVGEWTAMACGGIHRGDEVDAFLAGFDPDALRVPGVVFAALGAPAGTVLAELGDRTDVVLSHDNAPNQSMVCGPEDVVEALVTTMRGRGVLGQVLPFRSGFHTPMLAPYLGPIRAAAERYTLHPPTTPVWSATTASPYPADPAAVRDLFVRHLLEPVRFRELIQAMHDAGFRAFVQLGAGQLGSLVGDTLAGRDHLVVAAHAAARDCLAQLRRVVTALWVDGAAPDAEPLPGAHRVRPAAVVGRGQGVRLDLGGALVSLPAQERGAFTVPVRPEPVPAESALGVLGRAGARYPVAAELSALLRDTASVAAELITAVPTQRAPERPSVLRVDVTTMPYLLDHCFFRQRPGWPDERDRWPIVPATTVLTHLADVATTPGTVAVALHDARMTKWVEAIPAIDLPVRTRPAGPGRTEVKLADRASAVVETAARYPEPPAAWRFDPSTERVPELTAAQLYDERWMFHGPRFQGVRELTAIGARHVRATLNALPAPGALLDNVGQVLGYWIMSTLTERTTVFPVSLRRLRFFGQQPGPDATLECLVRITEVTDSALTADMQLVHDGRVWADMTGWADRRFDTDPGIRRVDRYPGTFTLSSAEPGGWALVRDRWPDLATRELIMRNVLGGAERETYAALAPRRRRSWLLGRIAAKDAVRQVLWAEAEGEIYPAELVVGNEPSGRPVVRGAYGREIGEMTVSIAHRGELGVAIARRGPCGIDIEEVAARPRPAIEAACSAEELALFDEVAGASGTALWFTRFWAAKEAVAKACGTGLRGDPRRFRVVAATAGTLTVECGQTSYRVGLADVPDHVVAWTLEPEGEQ